MKNPHMMQRLRDEITTLPESYSSVDLAALPYLDAVIRETLRVYPPAPSPMPRIIPPQGFSAEGVDYPPNVCIVNPDLDRRRHRADWSCQTIISAQPYTIHRCTEIFEQPEVFNPDRWLSASSEKKERMNKAFVPFSAGQRGYVWPVVTDPALANHKLLRCIGRGLAWMHMTKAIAKLLTEFDRFEIREDMTDDDMVLIERGALAKPKSTKLWARCYSKA